MYLVPRISGYLEQADQYPILSGARAPCPLSTPPTSIHCPVQSAGTLRGPPDLDLLDNKSLNCFQKAESKVTFHLGNLTRLMLKTWVAIVILYVNMSYRKVPSDIWKCCSKMMMSKHQKPKSCKIWLKSLKFLLIVNPQASVKEQHATSVTNHSSRTVNEIST